MCLFPRLVPNPKYRPNQKNGGVVPEMTDGRVAHVPIGCGHCMECRKQKATTWRTRLLEEVKHDRTGRFVTFTFSPAAMRHLRGEVAKMPGGEKLRGYALDNQIAKLAVRRFLERWRRATGKSVKHWLVSELGQNNTERIHLHGIIWTTTPELIDEKWNNGSVPYGYVWQGKRKTRREGNKVVEYFENYVNAKTANYITKYILKPDLKHPQYKSIVLCSPGIGKGYMKTYNFKRHTFKGKNTKREYVTSTGHKIALPIYYRNYAWSEEEREKLWLLRLDEGKRYVLGKEVSVKDGEEEYNRALAWAQKRNNEWGFGGARHWSSRDYENQRRNLRTAQKLFKNYAYV